jgi:hypothetical protein
MDGKICREPGLPVRFAFTNHRVSIGLQAVGAMPEHVARAREFFRRPLNAPPSTRATTRAAVPPGSESR